MYIFYSNKQKSIYCFLFSEEACICKRQWSFPGKPKCQNQNGCTKCDESEGGKHWCVPINKFCTGVEKDDHGNSKGIFYCSEAGCNLLMVWYIRGGTTKFFLRSHIREKRWGGEEFEIYQKFEIFKTFQIFV